MTWTYAQFEAWANQRLKELGLGNALSARWSRLAGGFGSSIVIEKGFGYEFHGIDSLRAACDELIAMAGKQDIKIEKDRGVA